MNDIAVEYFLSTIDRKSLRKRIEKIEDIVHALKTSHLLSQQSSSSEIPVVDTIKGSSSRQKEIHNLYMNIERVIFGRHKERDLICRMLREGSDAYGPSCSTRKPYSVIGIYGISGSGKSTLARYVCGFEKGAGHFNPIIFIHVGKIFSLGDIFRDMLEQITHSRPSNDSLRSLKEELGKALKHKCFLLVLDDLWVNYENQQDKKILLDTLSVALSGSRILVTSQTKDAAAVLDAQEQILIPDLDEEQYFSMFMHHALQGADDGRFRSLGRKIAKKLHRSPIAAVTVGKQLSMSKNISFWERTAQLDVLNMTMGALWWGYQQLSFDIRRCFAFCSTFPRGYELKRDELIRIWIAQGFVTRSNATEELESVGQRYFDELLSISFLQAQRIDVLDTEIVTIHDLVHELADRVGGSDFYRIVWNDSPQDIPPEVRHLFVGTNNRADITEKILDLVNLRTLIIVDESYDQDPKNFSAPDVKHKERLQDPLINEEVFESMFKRLSKLRVLIVMTRHYHKQMFSVPASIDQMKHLHYITFNLFSSRGIVELVFPSTSSKLYHMQTINVVPFCKVSCPRDMATLIYLRHITVSLSFPSPGRMTSFPQLNQSKKSMFQIEHFARKDEATVPQTRDSSFQSLEHHLVVQPWFLVVTVSILGLVFLAHTFGAINLDLVLNTSLGMRRGGGNRMSNNFDPSHGRMLLAINQDTEDKSSVGVDTRMTEGDADGPWKDQKALAPWISNQKSDQSGKGSEETTNKLNGTEGPYLSARKTSKTSVILWVAIPSAILFCCTVVLLWYKCGNRLQQNEPLVELELWQVSGPMKYQYNELAAATRNFNDENKLGEGGFGPVYRGILRNHPVAIKKLSVQPSSWQGQREFLSEVNVMTQLRHKNIVQLLGWCSSNRERLLVYELVAQGSLEKHLYSVGTILSWQRRYKIILDLSSALFYLHQCCDKCIVHGDIKPENIMLDASYSAKLGDFGTARLLDREADPRITELIAGTRGYIDPMFINNRVRCPEADVYSFGATLLEIACGKRASRRQSDGASALVSWVRGLYDQSMILDAADEKLNAEFDQKEMEHVLVTGLWCALPEPSQRPSIAEAMDVLRFPNARLPVLPQRRDPQLNRIMEDLVSDSSSVDAVNATTYLTSRADTAYLLGEE
ncbi:uncharacterized protein [Miscanthus floridulus]|uniref:uncharacterized protein n=1 Tax=Miscanthus floridulus TaxID=154761 RepID=UPI00345845A6